MSASTDVGDVWAGRAWGRRLVIAVMAVLGALLLLTGRAVLEGASELEASDEAFNRGDVQAAVLHARRAAISYAPGAPHVRSSYQRLLAVARGSEQRGDRDDALAAWRAIRAALTETEHFWIADPALLNQARENVARLERSAALAAARGHESRQAPLLEQPGTRPAMVLPLVGGLIAALVGLFGVARGGLPRPGAGRMPWYWLAACVLGTGCWLVSVLLA